MDFENIQHATTKQSSDAYVPPVIPQVSKRKILHEESSPILGEFGNEISSMLLVQIQDKFTTNMSSDPNEPGYKMIWRHWHEGDVRNGLALPLKMWPSKAKRINRRLYSQRKLLVEEIEYCGGIEDFQRQYVGFIEKSYRALRLETERRRRDRGQIVDDL